MKPILLLPCLRRSAPTSGVYTLSKQLVRLGVQPRIVALSDEHTDSALADFESSRIQVDLLHVSRKNPVSGVMRLRRYLEGHNGVVHSTCLRPDLFCAFGAVRGHGRRLVSTVRSRFSEESAFNSGPIIGRAVSIAWARGLCGFDLVVAHSEGIKASLLSCGVPETLLRVVPSGIDCDDYDVPSDEERSRAHDAIAGGREVLVGYVGRLVKLKAVDVLIRAFAELVKSTPAKLLIVGDGPERPMLERTAVSLGLLNRIIWAGQQRDVRSYLRALDIFAMSSITEGLPRALLEAGATGIPAVVTDISGCNEIVTDGLSGYVVPVRNPNRMGEALYSLAKSGLLRREMGRRLRMTIEERFSAVNMARGYLDVYRSLL